MEGKARDPKSLNVLHTANPLALKHSNEVTWGNSRRWCGQINI